MSALLDVFQIMMSIWRGQMIQTMLTQSFILTKMRQRTSFSNPKLMVCLPDEQDFLNYSLDDDQFRYKQEATTASTSNQSNNRRPKQYTMTHPN
jgi:hypothetical protein